VKVDLRRVSFRQELERSRGAVTVVTGIFDSDGNYVSGIQKVFELRLRDETFGANPGLVVRNTFDLSPGTYLVRLVVRDAESQVMASKNTRVEIP
jgi:predicted HicB family RNase H-like nuclease